MRRLLDALAAAAVVAVTGVLTALTRWAGPAIYCGDGWFHVRYATILRDHGISRSFPWWRESFLAVRFTDFNLLYHLLLVPFTWGDELTGARVASVLFACAAMASFWWCARSLAIPWPAFTACALLAIAPEYAYRLTYTRPLVLAFALLFLGTGAVLRGRGRLAALLTFLFAHTHCSFHLLPAIALLHDAQRTVPAGTSWRTRFSTSAWALGGAVAGSVVTPYFPNNLSFWWTANVGVLKASWAMGDLLRVGTEMQPISTAELLAANVGVFAAFAFTLYGMTRASKISDDARTLLVTALGFFGLSLLSQRFVELWAPYTVLLAGVVARDLGLRERVLARTEHRRALRAALAGALVIVLAAGLRRVAHDNGAAAAAEDQPLWREAGRWIKAGVPSGETIFHLGWDEFPELFFEDTTHRYLIGQDATFFFATDAERCRLWAGLARGRTDDAWTAVRRAFGCRWAFVPRKYRSFLALARRDPRFRERWSDGNAVVLELDDRGETVGPWEVQEGRPDPLRRAFDDDPRRHVGPVVGRAGAGFVDLARAASLPPTLRDVCVVATADLPAAAAGTATLGITTRSEIHVLVGDREVYAHSPLRAPAAGSPGGPPLDLEALRRAPARDGAEVEVPVSLRAGSNDVLVEACRTGEEFGFVLRVR